MPFTRPTIQTLIDRAGQDVVSRLPDVDPLLRRSLIYALIRAVAGGNHGLHGHLEWIAKQVVPDMAESVILERHASWWGIGRKPAAAATGSVTFTGSNGKVIAAGTVVRRADGEQYTVDAAVTIAGGTASAAVTGNTAGASSNSAAGTSLSLITPRVGINSTATVAAGGLSGGADIEDDDALRERLRLRVQQPPAGGSKADYERWALEVPGVTRAWCVPMVNGPGTVGVYFVRDDDPAGAIPDVGEIAAVFSYIDVLRPVTAHLYVLAPTPVAQDLTIRLTPNTTAVQDAVRAELADLFLRESEAGDGNGKGTILYSHLAEAISFAAGETDHELISPTGNIVVDLGEIATLGEITWQT